MVSIKLKFRKSVVPGKGGSCYIQLIHQRKVRTIATGFHLKTTEWNKAKGCVNLRRANLERVKELLQIQDKLQEEVRTLQRIIAEHHHVNRLFTVDMIVQTYRSRYISRSFFSIMQRRIYELEKNGQFRTAVNYRNTMRMFLNFCKDTNLAPSQITDCLMKNFEFHLRAKGNSLNTISFYMRILQATYNYIVMQGWIQPNCNPFKFVFTGVEKTVKRAVDIDVVRSIVRVDLKNMPDLDFARDLFLFSIYTRGMAFVDLAHLQKSDIQNNMLVYRRRKTKQLFQILLPACAIKMIEKYAFSVENSSFLFPVLYNKDSRNPVVGYNNALRLYNRRLNRLAGKVGAKFGLTSYVARHTWATLAKRLGVKVCVISEALGHTSERTTQVYLDSIGDHLINQANEQVIAALALKKKV